MDIGALSTAGEVLTLSSLESRHTRSPKLLLAAKLKIVPRGGAGAGEGGDGSTLTGHLCLCPGAPWTTASPAWPG